jgi:hypothetical protein
MRTESRTRHDWLVCLFVCLLALTKITPSASNTQSVSQSGVKQIGAAPIFTRCGKATLTLRTLVDLARLPDPGAMLRSEIKSSVKLATSRALDVCWNDSA